jgi:hypothetical protein
MTWTRIAPALSRCLILGLTAVAWPAAGGAAPDRDTVVSTGVAGTGFELIAFEAPGCNYCPVFRRDVLPSYPATRAGKTAPLRFIDVNEPAAERLQLSSPVTVVPTLVIMRDGVEIGRINGYFGRENMHRMLDTLLPAARD